MTTPPPSITVITANGSDYVVPGGQSWIPVVNPDGSLMVNVFNEPFQIEDDGTNSAKGQILGSFSDVEAVYPSGIGVTEK